MTTNYTQFLNCYISAFTDSVTDPALSKWFEDFDRQVRYNVFKRKVEEVTLNNAATYALSLAGLALTDWHLLVVRCVGKGTVQTAGKDTDGVTAITGVTPIYGTALYPGILFLSTYNLTAAPTIASQADSSVFEVFDATCVEDGA